VERKLAVARRSRTILVERIEPEVFLGDEQYLGSAAATIEGVRAVERELPFAKTILGISNVSFGLPPAGREVLNSVFLFHATKAGLDYAIVNAGRPPRSTP